MIDYPFQPGQPAEAEVRRIADSLLGDALDLLHARGKASKRSRDEQVHEARKRLKELRALIRLVRDGLVDEDGHPVYRRENESYRDAGRLLSDARDAAVMVETLDSLRDASTSEGLQEDAFSKLHEALRRRHQTIRDKAMNGDAVEQSINLLETAHERIGNWRLEGDAWDVVRRGLSRVYRKGRRAMNAAIDGLTPIGDAETFHDWRKRAKDLRYHFELLRNLEPAQIHGLANAAKEFTDDLGLDHDLAVLKQLLLHDEPDLCDDAATRQQIGALIEARRTELQKKAAPDGRALYADPPRELLKRLHRFWLIAHAAASGEPNSDKATPS